MREFDHFLGKFVTSAGFCKTSLLPQSTVKARYLGRTNDTT
jgi:hypothetical protein